ncbi:MAG: aspartate aminotransferase family protein [Alphaproteobacteria bacterium]|nr:aspartate aminotransferase family protein [Alphaproteobacteria bacterium]
MATYARQNIVFERGAGCWLTATTGEQFLDFGSGVAVNALGHAHPHLVSALTEQAGKLWHTSNLYRVAGQERLAERLCQKTFADKVFFCNSGAEACEGAIKAARRYHYAKGNPERWRIITFQGAFHGRTLTALSAAGNPAYLEGFGEPAAGFDHVAFADLDAARDAITEETAAIMVEPVQGEGGVRILPAEFLAGLRELCDKHGLLLVLDEVQTGVGRTGTFFAYEQAGIVPDLMAIAKGIGGGFPLGAILATNDAASGMVPGTHGSTFGGNPLAMAVANAVLDVVLEDGFLEDVARKSARLRQGLAEIEDEYSDLVAEIRIAGLLTGLKLRDAVKPAQVVAASLAEKLLLVGASDNVVRLLPPLVVSEEEIADGLARLKRALSALRRTST